MPLFKCAKCKVIENTALTACSWNYKRGKMLCSKCCPDQRKWHGAFKRDFGKLKDDYNKNESNIEKQNTN